ncbi:PAS domain S-box protein [Hyalangium rubrum]|uniref:histidine kinase n=1 Tax=Hyalangium rubrum TaxID=3103134 RepID=A0ABU5HER7_9BACT|nr:PAS domain S-box protein [Hyalangium sp. s54d21]MDY7231851.1 PAS domain S-box protein [Hyalangium sp. s54d21]
MPESRALLAMSSASASFPSGFPPAWTFSAKDLTDTSPIAVIEWDAQYRVHSWNRRATELFGWKAEEVRGRHPRDWGFIHEGDAGVVGETMRRLVEGEVVWNVSHNRNYRKDGSVAHCEWYNSTIRDPSGKIICILSQALDVTEREVALAQLEESERRFKATFEQAAVGISHVALDGRWLRVNKRLCEILGYSPEEMTGWSFQDVTHPEDLARDLDHVNRAIAGQISTYSLEKRYFRKSGAIVWVNLTVSLVRKPDGTPDYFISVIEDITRRHRLEAERDRLLEREHHARTEAEELVRRRSAELEATRGALLLAERLATAGQLAAGVGHEINNPLSYVLANVTYAVEELARLKVPTPGVDVADVQRALVQAQLGAERIRDVVRDLRIFSRSDPEASGPVDVTAALEFAIGMTSHQLRQRARLVRRYEPVEPVLGNESRLGQAFLNLLLNAAQAIPEGASAEHEVAVTVRPEGPAWVAVEIRDTGVGIAAEHLPRIFEPFFTTKRIGEGSGLGLSVCHGIVTGLGGQLQVESKPGQGSTFRVLLPAAPLPASLAVTSTRVAPERQCPPRRVLVIDDDPEVRESLSRIIGPAHVIEHSETGKAAQELLVGGADYDVIFCDVMMPDVTGMDLHDVVAARRPELLERMVFMSAGTFTPRTTEFFERVSARRIDKPFDPTRVRSFLA